MPSQSLKRLEFMDRNHKHTTPTLRQSTNIVPREVLEGHPAALAAWDEFTSTREAQRDHLAEARKLREQAEADAAKYRAAVREAMLDGSDTSKLKNNSEALLAKADAHEQIARQAAASLVNLGNALAVAIAEAAPDLMPNIETSIERDADKVRADLAGFRKSWASWGRAFHLRRILGHAQHYGGPLDNYDPNIALPSEVAAAIDVIERALTSLDRLRADEIEWQSWAADNH